MPGLGLLSGEDVNDETWKKIHFLQIRVLQPTHLWDLNFLFYMDGI